MMASSHIIVGGATWFYVSSQFGFNFDASTLGAAVLGALAPDIDHPKSTLGQLVKPLSAAISFVFGHRGITHSVLAVFACLWVWQEYAPLSPLTLPFLIGYMTHLAGDMLTPAGLPLLWPLKRRRTFSLPIMKTGGFSEQLTVTVLAGWMISGLFPGHWRDVSLEKSWPAMVETAREFMGWRDEKSLASPRPERKPGIPA